MKEMKSLLLTWVEFSRVVDIYCDDERKRQVKRDIWEAAIPTPNIRGKTQIVKIITPKLFKEFAQLIQMDI